MKILIDRQWKKPEYTISRLYVDGQFFGCNTLEDTDRGLSDMMSVEEIQKKKVYGKTAIPSGTYPVMVTYSNRFKRLLPLVDRVKGFDGIRIHSGNKPADTLGCILVGKNDKVGYISNSRQWTEKLIQEIQKALAKGDKVTLTVK